MKNLKLTHIFILMMVFSGLLFSCGTEEEIGDETIELTLSASSISVGSPISFTLFSSFSGDVTSQSQFFVNGNEIEGNTFIPSEPNDSNEVYATFFTEPYPARSAFEVGKLPKGGLVEIEAIAYIK